MVTFNQFTRGTMRTMRAINREAKRTERRRIQYEKAAQKIGVLEAAADAVSQYEHLIELLTGAHRIGFSPIDWGAIADRQEASDPTPVRDRELAARQAVADYNPGWFARTLGSAEQSRAELERAVHSAVIQDQHTHRSRIDEISKRNNEIHLARRLLAFDEGAVIEVVTARSNLGDLPFSVEGLDLYFGPNMRLVAKIDGLDLDDMPDQSVSLLQSGRASVKQLSAGKVHELHRSNVCSSALRAAIEILEVVPVPAVEIVVDTDLLDPATGHIEPLPILAVKISRQALSNLALDRLDPVAAVERLGADMDWNRRRGFVAIADG